MKLVSIELEGFRGLAHQTINLEPTPFWGGELQPIVFIGGNGSGKSSILKAISILLTWFTRRIKNTRTNGLFFSFDDVTTHRSYSLVSLTLAHQNDRYSWSIRQKCQKEFKTNNKNLRSEAKSGYEALNQLVKFFHNLMEQDINTPLPVLAYYPTDRTIAKVSVHLPKNRSNPIPLDTYEKALEEDKASFQSFFEWFRIREDYENEQRSKVDSSYQDPQMEAVRRACGDLTGLMNLQVRRDTPVRMTIDKAGKTFRIEQLSDGEKGLLAIAGDLARRLVIANPGLSDPLQGEGIILIDEIELHLHPQWQSTTIENLCKTFPNCQFILTTHSPQVITNLESVYLLSHSPEGIIGESVHTYGKDSNRILETIMGAPERSTQIKEKFDRLFNLIDNHNLTEAQRLHRSLLNQLKEDDPELARADWLIARREVLGQQKA